MIRYALTLVVFAAVLIALGYATYTVAPPGSKAMTALYMSSGIGGIAVICAVLSLLIKSNRKLGMIGIHLGLIVPLLAMIPPGIRFFISQETTIAANQEIDRLNELLDQGDAPTAALVLVDGEEGSEEAWVLDFESGTPVRLNDLLRPKGYQAVGLAGTSLLGFFAFAVLLLQRPKPPAKPQAEAKPEG